MVTGPLHRPELADCGAISLGNSKDFAERLGILQQGLEDLVERLQPTAAAVEAPFHGKSARSALQLAHARGVALGVLGRAGVPVAEYSPAAIKKYVAGSGRAEKGQVRHMVVRVLRQDAIDGPDDVTDALAVALCHAGSAPTQALADPGAPRTWEALIRQRATRQPR